MWKGNKNVKYGQMGKKKIKKEIENVIECDERSYKDVSNGG